MTSACGQTEAPSTSATCALDRSGRQALRLQRQHDLVDPVSRRWRLRTLRLEPAVTVARDVDLDLPTRLGQPSANTVFEALLPSPPDQFLGRQLLAEAPASSSAQRAVSSSPHLSRRSHSQRVRPGTPFS